MIKTYSEKELMARNGAERMTRGWVVYILIGEQKFKEVFGQQGVFAQYSTGVV